MTSFPDRAASAQFRDARTVIDGELAGAIRAAHDAYDTAVTELHRDRPAAIGPIERQPLEAAEMRQIAVLGAIRTRSIRAAEEAHRAAIATLAARLGMVSR